MTKKFPFNDTILKIWGYFTLILLSWYSPALAKRFPQIGLSDSAYLDKLEEEFNDFILSPNDFPPIMSVKL
jgi:hypothetical protein